jgi:hypothetical protein
MLDRLLARLGRALAGYLSKPRRLGAQFATSALPVFRISGDALVNRSVRFLDPAAAQYLILSAQRTVRDL